jgi:hypothetical protein
MVTAQHLLRLPATLRHSWPITTILNPANCEAATTSHDEKVIGISKLTTFGV